jgi:hypothetical protein
VAVPGERDRRCEPVRARSHNDGVARHAKG